MSAAPIVPDPAEDSASAPQNHTPAPLPWPFLVAMAAIAGLAELAYGVVNNSTMPVYVNYGLGFPALVGFAGASFLLAEALLAGPAGILADRLGRRLLIVIGPLLSVATCILTALLRIPHHHGAREFLGITALIALRFIDGAGAAAIWPALFASIGDRVDTERQSTAMGVLNVSYMMGLAFGPLIGGALNDHFGARHGLGHHDPLRYAPSFVVAATAFLIAAIVSGIVVPKKAAGNRQKSLAVPSVHGAEESLTPQAVLDALRRIPLLIALIFIIFFGIGLIALNIKFYAMERLHVTETGFGWLLLPPALVIGALAVPFGRIGDIWGKAIAIRIGMAIAALSMGLILLFESKLALIVLGSLLGVGFIVAFPAYLALLSDIGGNDTRGSVIGAAKMFQGIGALLGAIIGPLLYQKHPLAPFVGAGVLLTIGFFLSLVGVRDPEKKTATTP